MIDVLRPLNVLHCSPFSITRFDLFRWGIPTETLLRLLRYSFLTRVYTVIWY